MIEQYQLTDSENETIRTLGSQAIATPAVIDSLTQLESQLPHGLRRYVAGLAQGTMADGFCLIRGLEPAAFTPIPQTPVQRLSPSPLESHWTTGALALIGESLGSVISYIDENNGALIHDVHPVQGEEKHIENSGSVNLGLHTENVHHPLRPDFVGLMCIRQPETRSAALSVSSAATAVKNLTQAEIEILRQPLFRSHYPVSFTRGLSGPRPATSPHPVLSGTYKSPAVRYNVHNTFAVKDMAERALRAFSQSLLDGCAKVILKPGEIALLDNRVVVHGRASFTPRYDGADRWLRRFYALGKIQPHMTVLMARPRVFRSISEVSESL
jgi:L-asparagine oxygenase